MRNACMVVAVIGAMYAGWTGYDDLQFLNTLEREKITRFEDDPVAKVRQTAVARTYGVEIEPVTADEMAFMARIVYLLFGATALGICGAVLVFVGKRKAAIGVLAAGGVLPVLGTGELALIQFCGLLIVAAACAWFAKSQTASGPTEVSADGMATCPHCGSDVLVPALVPVSAPEGVFVIQGFQFPCPECGETIHGSRM